MSYVVGDPPYEFVCDHEGCHAYGPARYSEAEALAAALDAGWKQGAAGEYCPEHTGDANE